MENGCKNLYKMHEISCDDSREFVTKEEAADVLFVFSVTAVVKDTLIHLGVTLGLFAPDPNQGPEDPGPTTGEFTSLE